MDDIQKTKINYWADTVFKKYFKIETQGGVAAFRPNKAQKIIKLYKKKYPYIVLLKARQLGMTTDQKLDDLDWIMTQKNQRCITIAHTKDDAKKIFNKAKFAFQELPQEVKSFFKLKLDRQDYLEFENMQSSIEVKTSGRSGTFDRVHISEFAKMAPKTAQEVITGTFPAMFKNKNSKGLVEFTANGSNHGKDLWDKAISGKSRWKPVFLNCFIAEDYFEELPIDFDQDRFLQEYENLAKLYNLQSNLRERYNISWKQFYWYYLQVLEYQQEVKSEYPLTAEEAFLTSGSHVFDLFMLQQLVPKEPIDVVEGGSFLVWKRPEALGQYIIGADCSEGNPDSDYSVAGVLDVVTGEQVAELSGRLRDHVFADKLALLGKMYNNALIAPERNNHGHSVINSLANQLQYKNIYEHFDGKFGWVTTAKSKSELIEGSDGIAKAMEVGDLIVNSNGFVRECFTFEYKSTAKSSMGASDKNFDDKIMAWSIAWFLRNHARRPVDSQGNPLMVA